VSILKEDLMMMMMMMMTCNFF